ncbi:SusD/RagB family nutrient-binding outer membrane lipoprotein [Prevotella sp. 10(H)]|uniref:SusD/RagB family nutrient-binding outer membrane lipoprotein n=1 Tax=Prevotella sp. 10(H) TaxID=1158294 RepID=UPI0004A70233|nr:SusD/RagB family nutrient-binding outer membrane lipoprotein [Prevotella sp. 10(H)]
MKKLIILFIVGLFFSCTGDFEEMNTNPNKQSSMSNNQAVLSAQIYLVRALTQTYETGFGKWVQYYTTSINATQSIHQSDMDIFWSYHDMQVNPLRSIEEVMRNTDETPHANYRAIAGILKSWAYLYMSDLLGSVPYFEATQGDKMGAGEDAFRPKFDSQEVIYKDINERLKEANSSIVTDADSPLAIDKGSDIFAKGDMMKWRKFANSLRARMLVRMSDADPEYAKRELAELFGNPTQFPVLESNDEDFGMTWPGGAGESYANDLAEELRRNEYTWPAASGLVNMFGRLNDPRMEVYFEPGKSSLKKGDMRYVGAPMAMNIELYSPLKRDTISQVNVRFAKYDCKKYVLTYAELMFIKAEAALKGMIAGDANQFYQSGIRANMNKFDIPQTEIDTYLAQNEVKLTAQNGLEQIITQRYIAMFFQARDIYPEIRRTGYPVLDYFKVGTNAADIAKGYPEKHFYPGSSDTRRKEYQDAMGITGNTMWECKLWFASKRTRDVTSYTDVAPTGLTVWRKVGGKYVSEIEPYEKK